MLRPTIAPPQSNAALVKAGQSNIGGMVDPPRRKQRSTSHELWEVSSHLDLVLNSLTDHAVITLDLHGVVTSWNCGAHRTTGYDQTEIVGQHFSCFYSKEDQEAGIPMHALAIADEKGKHESEGWRVCRNGDRIWANVVIHPVRDLAGTLRGFVSVTRDASQKLKIERLREELAQSQKSELVGQLTSGIAHDFNNLLTTIEAGHDLIDAYCKDERIARVIEFNKDAVDRSKKLISQLLSFSRRQVLSLESCNVFSVVSGLDALLQRAVGENIRLRWNLVPEMPKVSVDRAQLQSVLLNLVVNARDAMPDGGWLTIFMDKVDVGIAGVVAPFDVSPGEYLVLGVSDTGCGMAPDVRARAIEPFFTTKADGRGTGLGLSQCYGFARQSGGGMEIDSVPGKGTTVRVLLPVQQGSQALPAVRQSKTILFVDDETCIRALVSEVLRVNGHKVVEAQDGPAALEILRTNRSIDYLVTDIVMPNNMNGVQLMTAARQVRPGLPTLLASG
jgi:PAS domain S-box-containing protein